MIGSLPSNGVVDEETQKNVFAAPPTGIYTSNQ
jgi:hypothetical protein